MAIAVVAIGTFALPNTVSLFSGQHTWYDLSASVGGTSGVNNVPCEKCHADVAGEMTSSANGAHRDLTCAMCHRAPFTGYTYARGHYFQGASGYQATRPGKEAHAASTVECMDCHGIWHDGGKWNHWSDREYSGACNKCHGGGYSDFISAGGFGIEDPANPGHNTTDEDTGEYAAHKTFVLNAMDNEHMEGANEACIACHTHAAVNITWVHAHDIEFTAAWDDLQWHGTEQFPPTHFNVSDWAVNGTVTNHSYGNATGAGKTEPWEGW